MADVIQIAEILQGYTVDKSNIQSVGNMTVIPIVSDTEFTNVANINEVSLDKDMEYTQMRFKNSSGEIAISLQGWTIIDKQPAQDRTIPYAHLIKAANSKVLPANCVQSNQCGTFHVDKWSQENFMILPPSLRGIALKKSPHDNAEVGALWDSLGTWVKGINCKEDGLKHFYSKFSDKLDQFVAQFEPVEKQLGAVVLINDEVIAFDIVPKYESWKAVWRAIIRDSYGAEALRMTENNGAVINHPVMKTEEVKTVDDLDRLFSGMKNEFYDGLQSKVGQAIQLSVGQRQIEQIDELSNLKLESEQFIGQGIIHGDSHFVYLSLVNSSMGEATGRRKKFQSLRGDPYNNDSFFFN